MKKSAQMFSILLLSLILAAPVFAQTVTPASSATTPSTLSTARGTHMTMKQTLTQDRQAFQAQKQAFREKLTTERATFKQQLAKITDQRKQTLVTNINDRIASVSADKTTTMNAALSQMTTILNNITQQEQTLKTQGTDTTMLESAIAAAQQAITAADTSVTTQAGKVYTLTITNDATLRESVGQTVSQFRTDLSGVYQQVVSAKQAVMQAAMELAKIR